MYFLITNLYLGVQSSHQQLRHNTHHRKIFQVLQRHPSHFHHLLTTVLFISILFKVNVKIKNYNFNNSSVIYLVFEWYGRCKNVFIIFELHSLKLIN